MNVHTGKNLTVMFQPPQNHILVMPLQGFFTKRPNMFLCAPPAPPPPTPYHHCPWSNWHNWSAVLLTPWNSINRWIPDVHLRTQINSQRRKKITITFQKSACLCSWRYFLHKSLLLVLACVVYLTQLPEASDTCKHIQAIGYETVSNSINLNVKQNM